MPSRISHHKPRSWTRRSGQRQTASVCALLGAAGEEKGYFHNVSHQVIQNRQRVLACLHDSTRSCRHACCRGNVPVNTVLSMLTPHPSVSAVVHEFRTAGRKLGKRKNSSWRLPRTSVAYPRPHPLPVECGVPSKPKAAP
ncbi:hypothetical protein TcG_08850 [Trypanosoma cruzi]|nr:hypothetical protein TcG_08850 [Trypanosoma cruzi]